MNSHLEADSDICDLTEHGKGAQPFNGS
ncbi:hypothetical protein JMJ77_0013510 [Colletotrichum scovillei]|uniref:Uncharacterized protein n=1 Tax=Colletotrichum scovillei TaxID=1209932 RepID=A0A9P7R5U9_9PEZI|nr:hypothetical protein JMJ77_0013510 [Colletotrichum scovillei]KAG7069814.1 hypothetical protein JMJ76_0003474 [Colletotrichum scovillei]KAG7073729.1 hypothetical protein JMJ78_0014696 [Colletotrichum scovillei]